MSNKSTFSKAFNKHFFEFLDDMSNIFPENDDIKVAKKSFETIKRLNTTAIIKAWYLHVYLPYKDVIDDNNIDFFIQKDYSNELSGVNKGGDILNMIDKIRKPISEMGESNKSHCAKYIQNLSKLSFMYTSQ
tara:strand:+ start:381 stop:776 length:396 start_codon:yes stop_codon:yes gene_type:complete